MKRIAIGALLAATAAVGLHAQTAKPTKAAVGPVKTSNANGPQIGAYGFDVDGMEVKCRHDFGAAAIDYRGVAKSNGA